MDTTNILGNIRVLMLDIRLWSGRSSLKPEDCKLADGSELPPETLAKLGSKLLIDPKELAPLNAFKQRVVRAALAVGTRFIGGFAIPENKINDLVAEIDEVETLFMAYRGELLERYDEKHQAWKDANPGWESVIQNASVSVKDVARAVSFSAQVINVAPVVEHSKGLEIEVKGLAGQLRREIEVEAKKTWKDSYKGQVEVTQKAIRPLRSMLSKIEGLVFIDSGLYDIVEGIKDVLASLPKDGFIKGRQLAEVCGVLSLLGDIPEANKSLIANALAEAEEAKEAIAEAQAIEVAKEEAAKEEAKIIALAKAEARKKARADAKEKKKAAADVDVVNDESGSLFGETDPAIIAAINQPTELTRPAEWF